MTWGELKRILEDAPDELEVMLQDDEDMTYRTLKGVFEGSIDLTGSGNESRVILLDRKLER